MFHQFDGSLIIRSTYHIDHLVEDVVTRHDDFDKEQRQMDEVDTECQSAQRNKD